MGSLVSWLLVLIDVIWADLFAGHWVATETWDGFWRVCVKKNYCHGGVTAELLAVEGIPAVCSYKNCLLVHFCLAQLSYSQIFAVNGSSLIAEGPGGTPECSPALRDSLGSLILHHPNNPRGQLPLIFLPNSSPIKNPPPSSHWKFPLFPSPTSVS